MQVSWQHTAPRPRELSARRLPLPDLSHCPGDRKRVAGAVLASLVALPLPAARFRCPTPERTPPWIHSRSSTRSSTSSANAGIAASRAARCVPPPGDPVLFTTSGMHPLTPYLEGRPHPLGRRLVGVQRCLRTTDLDEVGDRTHLTVFEMLGSWSLGDYPGEQSLRWGYELLRDGFGIDPGRLHVTVFGGDDQVGPDTGLLETWGELGVPVELTGEDNWWSNGPTGLCGTGLRDLRVDRRQPAAGHTGHRRALGGGVEPRHDALPRPGRRHPDAAVAAQRGHRHGPGAAADGAAGPGLGVRHRPAPALDRRCRPPVAGGGDRAAAGHRPPAVQRGGDRRRRDAVQHRPRLRAAPAGPPRR